VRPDLQLSRVGLVKKISREVHERTLAERKKLLGLTGRDYVAKNSGDRRTADKKALLEELSKLGSPVLEKKAIKPR
jgi:hypothetical protein